MVTCTSNASVCKAAVVPFQIKVLLPKNRCFGSSRCSWKSRERLPRQSCQSFLIRRPARSLPITVTAWAAGPQTTAYTSSGDSPSEAGLTVVSSEFNSLCYTQLRLVSEILRREQVKVAGPQALRLTLYQRDPVSLDEGHLQLCQVTSFTIPGPDSLENHQILDESLSLGDVGNPASAYGAEEALAQAQLVDLPHNGGLVLPLAAHGFLVGLLVIEGCCTQAALITQDASAPAASYALTGQNKELVTLAGRVLASACAMELHSALERAQSLVHRQQVIGLVEEVRGPLTALRTLGSILVPRLRQAQGREVDRDVVQGMLTQGDRLQDLVKQLQTAIHPAEGPSVLKQLTQQDGTRPATDVLHVPETNMKQLTGAADTMPHSEQHIKRKPDDGQ